MSQRKSHKKSRKGCFQCKRRHAKCDEKKPTCSNCDRLEIDCSWPNTSRSTSIAESIVPSSSSSGLQSDQLAAPALATDDLRLMHHWTLNVSVISDKNANHVSWQDAVVQLSFRHPFLLHGILSVSAIHLATTMRPAEREKMIHQSTSHINLALQEFRRLLANPERSSAAAMFALSALLVPQHFGISRVQEDKSPIEQLVTCFKLLRGINSILQPYWLEVMSSEVASLLSSTQRNPVEGHVPQILALLELVGNHPNHSVYTDAIQAIHDAFLQVQAAVPAESSIQLIFIWPIRISDEFVNLISTKDLLALVILAYYGMIIRIWGDAWWLEGWDGLLMSEIKDILPEGQFDQYLVWPQTYVDDGTAI